MYRVQWETVDDVWHSKKFAVKSQAVAWINKLFKDASVNDESCGMKYYLEGLVKDWQDDVVN